MGRKLGLVAGMLVVGFYLITAPQSAAGTLRHAGTGMGHVVHQLSVFLRSL